MNDSSPIMICGCPGSGTSLFAKMLRYRGVFLGSDAGPIGDRKFHESASFRDANNRCLQWAIRFPHAPKGVHQFKKLERLIQRRLSKFQDLIQIESVLEQFWANKSERDLPWGWKDPRNSALALVWKTLFPNLRVVVLQRNWSDEYRRETAKSIAGSWFRKQSTKEIRDFYNRPFGIDESEIVRVDFESLLVNSSELNRVLTDLKLQHLCVIDFAEFRAEIGIEEKTG